MQKLLQNQQSNILTCARYAFRPNELTYCGPDQNRELFQYLEANTTDGGLEEILKKFETLFPYLQVISHGNKESDIFAKDVVDAYWIGNVNLLNIDKVRLYEHLAEELLLKKKLHPHELEVVKEKVGEGVNPHHSFHVFNIWRRTGYVENSHTLFTMDECRIGWGSVKEINGNILKVLYRPLVFNKGLLEFGEVSEKKIFYSLPGEVNIGDWISFHWSSYCEVLTKNQIYNLKKWTTINLNLANKYAKS